MRFSLAKENTLMNPTEIRDDGLQVHGHTYDDKSEAPKLFIFRFGGYHDVQAVDWILDVPG
jgi:hypothetical protein